MYTKKFIGANVATNGQKYAQLLITSEAVQDRGTKVTSFNPKDVAKVCDGEGNFLPQEVIDNLAEETIENFDKVVVPLDGIYNRISEGRLVLDKANRPAQYTTITVACMWSYKYDYLFVDGKPFINPVTGSFDKYPVVDPATNRPKRFYDQGWSPEERVASMIEAGFYVKANAATQVNQPNPGATTDADTMQRLQQEAAARLQQTVQQPNPAVQPNPTQPTM
jgi:hypothetical protein